MPANSGQSTPKGQYYWLIYAAALIAGLLLIADALGYYPLQRITAKLGIALIYSALALMIGGSRPSGIIATVVVWFAVLLTFLV